MAMSRKTNFGMVLIALAIVWLVGGFAAVSDLFLGVFDGLFFLFRFLLSWFTDVEVFNTSKLGMWYSTGFVVGLIAIALAKGVSDKARFLEAGHDVARRDYEYRLKCAADELMQEKRLRAAMESQVATVRTEAYRKGYAAAKKLGELANKRRYAEGFKAGKAENGSIDGLTYHTVAARYHQAVSELKAAKAREAGENSKFVLLMQRIDELERELAKFKQNDDAKAA